jgi:hypothetical protein
MFPGEKSMVAFRKTISVPLGQLVATPGALTAMMAAGQSPVVFLRRHAQGDWGDVCAEDRRLNDASVKDGSRLLSVYQTALGVKIWVITEADRSSTCILLPEEY